MYTFAHEEVAKSARSTFSARVAN